MVKKERQVHLSALFFGPLPRVILQNCRILKLFYRWIRQNFTFAQKIKMVHIKTVSSHEELVGIKKLLEANLKQNLSPEERASQGFVTCDYSIEFLTTIQQKHPSIIAVDQGEVVGYALVVTRDSKHLHPLIEDLVDKFPQYTYNNTPLDQLNFCMVGQLCVGKSHRGQGLVQRLYHGYRDHYSHLFNYLITDVDTLNTRSLKAHQNTGFQVVGQLEFGQAQWNLVVWEW
jgi:hypothetical protein